MANQVSFNKKPTSLSTFFPTGTRQKAQDIIFSVTITSSGEVIFRKTHNTEDYFSIYNFNLLENHGHWKYLIGSENVKFFLAIKENFNWLKGKISTNGVFFFSLDPSTYGSKQLSIDETGWGQASSSRRADAATLFDKIIASSANLSTSYSEGSLIEGDYLSRDPAGISAEQYFYDDYLIGTEFEDAIMGYRGNDTLVGGKGNDELYGGYGNDVIKGEDGNDYLYGEQGNDRLEGGNGDDYLDGGLGNDTMIGGAGNDTYLVDRNTDIITDSGASTDVDTVLIPIFLSYTLPTNIEDGELTGKHNCNLTGNTISNDLMGNNGNNVLDGKAGNDEITGGLGNDTLIGGIGNDQLVGGTGKDLFQFISSVVTGTTGQGTDEIVDFQKGVDKIQIVKSGFKIGTTAITSVVISNSANNTFGTGANFHFNTATSDLFFKGQTTRIADVLGVTSLSASDFSLI
jgi:Ca2+-binding RTX toxin-like protein